MSDISEKWAEKNLDIGFCPCSNNVVAMLPGGNDALFVTKRMTDMLKDMIKASEACDIADLKRKSACFRKMAEKCDKAIIRLNSKKGGKA